MYNIMDNILRRQEEFQEFNPFSRRNQARYASSLIRPIAPPAPIRPLAPLPQTFRGLTPMFSGYRVTPMFKPVGIGPIGWR